MTEIEDAILGALRELEAAAGSVRTAGAKPDLLPLFGRLDELAARLPASAPAMLKHYLEGKSYQKARLLLEGSETVVGPGACGRPWPGAASTEAQR